MYIHAHTVTPSSFIFTKLGDNTGEVNEKVHSDIRRISLIKNKLQTFIQPILGQPDVFQHKPTTHDKNF